MNRAVTTLIALIASMACLQSARAADVPPLRPPAVPLVTCDPYFSIWSTSNNLTDTGTTHWTGKAQHLTSLVRIDGKTFRVMGDQPADVSALPQTSVDVLPTRTIYTFEGAGVRLTLTFTTPALPDDLMILSRPVTYLSWEAVSTDGAAHAVAAYFDSTTQPAVNADDQPVVWSRPQVDGLVTLRAGTRQQPVLQKKGDNLRIDWGYYYVAAPAAETPAAVIASATDARAGFMQNGGLPGTDVPSAATPASDAPVLAMALNLGSVNAQPASRWLMLAYDDLYSIQYFKHNLRPYWRRGGWEAADLLKASLAQHGDLVKQCKAFDDELMGDLEKAGGVRYARIAALAYRECFAANKIAADDNGQPLIFPKENFSNGCIATVDVIYPMAPQFLLFGPSLTKGMIANVMDYASSPRWKWPFAPHDLGTYPQANGQVYGGGERTEENQMPVEETGNMIILLTALAHMEGNADFAGKYWPTVTRWADYLQAKGFDPENQLCTDDFAGHLAHNVNLSAKAIVALGCYGELCEMRGEKEKAKQYRDLAKQFAERWQKEADDGDHFRLAFDRKGTWSQKYNLVWDRILGLGIFPDSVARKEMDFYKRMQNRYGLPLDNRKDYTKLDWTLWTASLTDNRDDFDAISTPVYRFLNATPDRSPMTDWYQTKTARRVGFTARPVVGGVFLRLLYNGQVWKKYASRDKTRASGWAPMPVPPVVRAVVPAADRRPAEWRYTTDKPADDWMKAGLDDAGWKQGRSGFGTRGTPGAVVNTVWNSADIWLRREVNIPANAGSLQLWIHHDEDAEVYINGVLAASASDYTSSYDAMLISDEARKAIKPGANLVAVHCHQTRGGQYIDVGFVTVQQRK